MSATSDSRSASDFNTAGVAQEYVTVAERPSPDLITDDPCLIRLPDGDLLATWTFRGTHGPWKTANPQRFQLARSGDDGRTWRRLNPLEINMGQPFLHQGRLYLLGNGLRRRDIIIGASDDGGESWTPFQTVAHGYFWNAPTGNAIKDGVLYRAFGTGPSENMDAGAWPGIVVVAGDLSSDLLDPKSWRLSNPLDYPGTPPGLRRPSYMPGAIPYTFDDHWLEPNVVDIRGRLSVLVRVRIATYATTNIAAVCDLEDGGGDLRLSFGEFVALPGAQNKFHIVYDEPSDLFWMVSNTATDSLNVLGHGAKLWEQKFKSGLGNERRIVLLHYSLDARNWLQAACLAITPNPLQSFHYVTPHIDGDDLLLLSRTSVRAVNQHDSDLITFHRLNQFRTLAVDLHPRL